MADNATPARPPPGTCAQSPPATASRAEPTCPETASDASTYVTGNLGDRILIRMGNLGRMPHTTHFHGLVINQANDGVGVISSVINRGGTFLYTFMAPHAGTYHCHCHCHCHEDTVLHYARGMYGTVIVRPPRGSISEAWTGGPTFDEEVLWQLPTLDPAWDTSQHSAPNGTARFNPEAFMLNGRETAAVRVFVRGRFSFFIIIGDARPPGR